MSTFDVHFLPKMTTQWLSGNYVFIGLFANKSSQCPLCPLFYTLDTRHKFGNAQKMSTLSRLTQKWTSKVDIGREKWTTKASFYENYGRHERTRRAPKT